MVVAANRFQEVYLPYPNRLAVGTGRAAPTILPNSDMLFTLSSVSNIGARIVHGTLVTCLKCARPFLSPIILGSLNQSFHMHVLIRTLASYRGTRLRKESPLMILFEMAERRNRCLAAVKQTGEDSTLTPHDISMQFAGYGLVSWISLVQRIW
jgi:hypothetical protein